MTVNRQMRSVCLKRKCHAECRALPGLRFDAEPAAMARDDMLDDGEAKAGAALRAALAGGHAIEPLGEARQMFRRDAGTVIADVQDALALLRDKGDVDLPVHAKGIAGAVF